ncbi:hypothetical protein OUZ56_005714 [Daphnia magna]|uniref:Uncharacterized protein n=1 Tax=Daphnia magna TaxID=35525 RepID=A0ABQ9YTM3_9CRUS|nr:hypothetical protein OUZ56_005714 [Daphnia magna]
MKFLIRTTSFFNQIALLRDLYAVRMSLAVLTTFNTIGCSQATINVSSNVRQGMEDDLPYSREMRVYHKIRISRRKRKITTKMEGRFPTYLGLAVEWLRHSTGYVENVWSWVDSVNRKLMVICSFICEATM